MEEFSIKGGNGNFLKIIFKEVYGFPETTCYWGGYDSEAIIEIKSENFTVRSIIWTSTGEINDLFNKLKACNEDLKGSVDFANYEDNLNFVIQYNDLGQVNIAGSLYELSELNNRLKFEFNSDQSFITETMGELKQIELKYGDKKGVGK